MTDFDTRIIAPRHFSDSIRLFLFGKRVNELIGMFSDIDTARRAGAFDVGYAEVKRSEDEPS